MSESRYPTASRWLLVAAWVVRRLPAGRYRAIDRIWRSFRGSFLMNVGGVAGDFVFFCDLRDSIAREVCFTGSYEPQETALIGAVLRSGETFVDVGANWGYFSLLAARLVGREGQVVSLEPDPRIFATLKQNAQQNAYVQMSPIQVAAADVESVLTLAGYDDQGDNWGLSQVVERVPHGAMTFQVTARRLDLLLDELGIEQVNLLKMDIEGAEDMAVRGMSEGLRRNRYDRILIELHPTILEERGLEIAPILRMFEEAGYVGWRIDHSPETTRRAAYGRRIDIERLLSPITEPLDSWPHLLWVRSGLEPLPS